MIAVSGSLVVKSLTMEATGNKAKAVCEIEFVMTPEEEAAYRASAKQQADAKAAAQQPDSQVPQTKTPEKQCSRIGFAALQESTRTSG